VAVATSNLARCRQGKTERPDSSAYGRCRNPAYWTEPRSPNWNSFLPSGLVTVTLKPPRRPSRSG